MKRADKKRGDRLAGEHWAWFEDVVGHVVRDFFIHGYKHGGDDERKRKKKGK